MKFKYLFLSIIFIISTNVVFCENEKILDIKPYILNYRKPIIPESICKLLDSVSAEELNNYFCRYYIKFQFDSIGGIFNIRIYPLIDKEINRSELYFQAADSIECILKNEIKLWKINVNSLFPDGMSYIDKNWKPFVVIFYDFIYESVHYWDSGTVPQSIFRSYINEEIYIEPKPNE